MIEQLLTFEVWGNNLFNMLLFLLILTGTYWATKLVYFIFKKIFKVITSKTKTNLDDLLVDALEKPFIYLIVVGGFYLGKSVLILNERFLNYYTKIFTTFVIFIIVWFIIRIVDAIMLNYFHPKTKETNALNLKIDDTVYPIFSKLVKFIILVIAFLLIIQNLGFQITSLIAGLGIGGLAFALAAQDILSNLFAGVAILTDKPFKVGDRIIISGQDGFVRKIGLRTTIIETWDGTQVVMPNKQVADNVLENITREKERRVKVILGVEYGTSVKKLEKAKKILNEIILKNKSTDDKCLVHFVNFNSYSLDIQLIYWIKDLTRILEAKDEINFEIKKAFEKEKIEFAFPSQTLYIKK